ncbi:MAG: hypothetical protein DDT29_01895 [Dehalococcoidia bacterium]|nr:hypothetical protein [Bacillota bacterium]
MTIATTTAATLGTHPITITGTGGGLVRTATFTLTVEIAPFNFGLAVHPTAATVTQGEGTTAAVTATLEAGITEEVTLTAGLPAEVEGITITFAPSVDEPTFESIMTIAAAADATPGVHAITITGTGAGGLVRTATFTLTVEPLPFDFSLAVEPTAATVTRGKETTATVTATHLAGITEGVTLTAALPEGVAGITITFAPASGDPTFTSAMSVATARDATLGEHVITITGTSAGGVVRTATFTLTVTDLQFYHITLVPGWNLMSLPLIPENPAIETVLAGILENVLRVWHYDAGTRQWRAFPGGATPLTQMVDGKGYWINMKAAATLTVVGREMPPPPALPPSYLLFKGWNHIGFKSTTPMTVDLYLGPAVMAIFERMFGFDAGTWFRVEHGDHLEPGKGYWLAVSEDGTIFPAGILVLE